MLIHFFTWSHNTHTISFHFRHLNIYLSFSLVYVFRTTISFSFNDLYSSVNCIWIHVVTPTLVSTPPPFHLLIYLYPRLTHVHPPIYFPFRFASKRKFFVFVTNTDNSLDFARYSLAHNAPHQERERVTLFGRGEKVLSLGKHVLTQALHLSVPATCHVTERVPGYRRPILRRMIFCLLRKDGVKVCVSTDDSATP